MKKYYFLFFVVLFGLKLDAQDALFLKDGSVVQSKIIEITPSEIKYKKFSYLDGPTIVIPKSEVEKVTYQDGTEELINKESSDNKNNQLEKQYKLYNPYIFVFGGTLSNTYGGNFGKTFTAEGMQFGLGHDGLFKFLSLNNNKVNFGAFYSINLGGGKIDYYLTALGQAISDETTEFFTVYDTYGLHFEFGKRNARFCFQGMVGSYYNIYSNQFDNESGLKGGGSFGIKINKLKFGFRVLAQDSKYFEEQIDVNLRVGVEF